MEATQSEIEALARFARGLQDDLTAVTAGLTLAWSHGVIDARDDNRESGGQVPGGRGAVDPVDHQHVHREADVVRRQLGGAVEVLLRPADLQEQVLALHITQLAQPLAEFAEASEPGFIGLSAVAEEADPRHLRWRLRGRRAAPPGGQGRG